MISKRDWRRKARRIPGSKERWLDMAEFLSLLVRYGYLILGLISLLGASGIPLPVTLTIVAAGVASARGLLHPGMAFGVSVLALLAGDALLYFLGRHTGWWLLGILCKLATNPELCILNSAQSFYRRGRVAILFAKFMPGVGVLAAPLAGSMKMEFGQFLRLDLLAACLYAGAFGSVGFLFGDLAAMAVQRVRELDLLLKLAGGLCIAVYVAYRIYGYCKQPDYSAIPRIGVGELAQRIEAAKPCRLKIIDVRSHGYYDPGAVRIKGSIRIEPNNLLALLKDFPREKEIYLYCT